MVFNSRDTFGQRSQLSGLNRERKKKLTESLSIKAFPFSPIKKKLLTWFPTETGLMITKCARTQTRLPSCLSRATASVAWGHLQQLSCTPGLPNTLGSTPCLQWGRGLPPTAQLARTQLPRALPAAAHLSGHKKWCERTQGSAEEEWRGPPPPHLQVGLPEASSPCGLNGSHPTPTSNPRCITRGNSIRKARHHYLQHSVKLFNSLSCPLLII